MRERNGVGKLRVSTMAGVDRSDLWKDAGRPPRRALHVVSIVWMWSPAHNLSCTYLLSRDRAQRFWVLWEKLPDFDTGKPRYARIAYLEPYRGTAAKDEAKQLLEALWRDESKWGTEVTGGHVEKPGLLTSEDIARIDATLEKQPRA